MASANLMDFMDQCVTASLAGVGHNVTSLHPTPAKAASVSMESVSLWTVSHIVVSAMRGTVVHSAINRGSCLIRADTCPASTVGAKFQTQEMLIATVKVDTPGSCVMQSLNAEASLCETSTKCSEGMPSVRPLVWCPGSSALVCVTQGPAVPARG